MLSFLSEKQLKLFLRKKGLPTEHDWPEAIEKDALLNALREIREEEMAIQVSNQHVVGFAVPIYKGKNVVASLGVFLPEARLTETHRRKIISLLKKASGIVSQNLTESINQPLLDEGGG